MLCFLCDTFWLTLSLGHSLQFTYRQNCYSYLVTERVVIYMRIIGKLLKRRKWKVSLTILLSILTISISLQWNSLLSTMINQMGLESGIAPQDLVKAILMILLIGGSQFLFTLSSGWTCEAITHDLRMAYASHLLHSNISELERMSLGAEISRLQNEIAEVSDYINSNLFALVHDFIKFIITIIWLLYLNSTVTILSNLPVVGILIYLRYASKIISEFTEKAQQSKMNMNGFANTLIELFPMIHIYNAGVLIQKQYEGSVNQWETNTIKEEKTRAKLLSFSGMLSSIPLMLLLLVGGRMVISGGMSIGVLYIFINLSGNVSGIMMNMPGYLGSFRRFSANMNRIENKLYFGNGKEG